MPTYADLVRRFGLAFRPDFPAYAYGEHANAYQSHVGSQLHDVVVRLAFGEYEAGVPSSPVDPYAAALAVWREDGLLTAEDPGPPTFRAAHAAYLAKRAGPPKALILEHGGEKFFPRPRIPIAALLDVVESFRSVAHPLGMLGADHPFTELRAARERLVAWFAERGVDVDPEG